MYVRRVINSKEAITSVVASLHELPEEPLHEVIVQPWKPPASDNQNRTIYMLYGDLAKHKREDDEKGWRLFCKYTFGVPILLKDEQHQEFFQELLDRLPLPHGYEKRIAAMEYVEVTALMGREQKTEYINAIYKHFHDVPLTVPKKKEKR